jgi:hypothetical protein
MALKDDYNGTGVDITGGLIDAPLGTRSAQTVIASPLISRDAAYLGSYTVLDGKLIIAYLQGTLPSAMASTDTSYDFQREMTPGDFLLLRWGGQFEYITVGALDSGTTYAITRDSTTETWGALDWPLGMPYVVLGAEGAGRLELSAEGGAPKLRIISQGATADAETTLGVLGELNGHYGISTSTIGLGLGVSNGTAAPTGAVLTVDATNGMKIDNGDSSLVINEEGLVLEQDTSGAPGVDSPKAIKWLDGATLASYITSHYASVFKSQYIGVVAESVAGENSNAYVEARAPTTYTAQSYLAAQSGSDTSGLRLVLDDDGTAEVRVTFGTNTTITIYNETGNIAYSGSLQSAKNSTTYTGYITVPLATPATSTSWDGDAKDTADNGIIDLSSVFGLPAGIKGVFAKLSAKNTSTTGKYSSLGADSSNPYALVVTPRDTLDISLNNGPAFVPCDSNGDIYYKTNAADGSENIVGIEIYGYLI